MNKIPSSQGEIILNHYVNYNYTLYDLVNKIGNEKATIKINIPVYIFEDLTIPSNITLDISIEGELIILAGKTLTLNCGIVAGLWQIFSGDGDVAGKPIVKEAYPQWFGAKADNINNDTLAVQNCIDLFDIIYFKNGIYLVDNLILKTCKHYIGENSHETYIIPSVSSNTDFITIDEGAVQYVRMENFWIYGKSSSNPGQNGLSINARGVDDVGHGGLWHSMFKNVRVGNFDGNALKMVGSDDNILPIQFITFERCDFGSTSDINADSLALLVEGQVEQSVFTNCSFFGQTQTQGYVAKFRRKRDTEGVLIPGADNGGNGMSFFQCYVGNSMYGLSFERSTNIKWYGGYFEKLNKCIEISTSSESITIDTCEFRECGVNSGGDGYLVSADIGNSIYRFINNDVVSSPDNLVLGGGFKQIYGNRLPTSTVINIVGTIEDLGITSNTLEIKNKGSRVAHTGSVRTINYIFQGTEEIYLIATNVDGFTLTAGGNLSIGADVVLLQYESVTLLRLNNEWIIKNILRLTDL